MKECIICEIINSPKYLEDTIIYENNFLIVKAAKGMVVPGHLLIIPKEHINGFAEFSIKKLNEVKEFAEKISTKIEKYMKTNVIFFEHGSLQEGRHPKSIVHAHLHIIPYNLTQESYEKIINGCQLKKIRTYEEIKDVEHKDYCYFKDGYGNRYLSDSIDFPRSIIFRVIAQQEGLEPDYEWREEKNNDKDKLVKTIELGKNICNYCSIS